MTTGTLRGNITENGTNQVRQLHHLHRCLHFLQRRLRRLHSQVRCRTSFTDKCRSCCTSYRGIFSKCWISIRIYFTRNFSSRILCYDIYDYRNCLECDRTRLQQEDQDHVRHGSNYSCMPTLVCFNGTIGTGRECHFTGWHRRSKETSHIRHKNRVCSLHGDVCAVDEVHCCGRELSSYVLQQTAR